MKIAGRLLLLKRWSSTAAALQESVVVHTRPAVDGLPLVDATGRWDKDRVAQPILRALQKKLGFNNMTPVQQLLMDRYTADRDILMRSKTGTGKTLAYLVPTFNRLLEQAEAAQGGKNEKGVKMLIIAPNRELVTQIYTAAHSLTPFMDRKSGIKVLPAYGGVRKDRQLASLSFGKVDVLVATPGRMLDLLESSRQVRAGMENLKVFVLDEADLLLEIGFARDLVKIAQFLPAQRQTILLSATLSSGINRITQGLMSEEYDFVDTVSEDDVPTHMAIKQTAVACPLPDQIKTVYAILADHYRENASQGKVIVFCNQKDVSKLLFKASMALKNAGFFNSRAVTMYTLTSDMSQERRTNTSKDFRMNPRFSVLFTTDVSARGVDYPGVTLVLQLGPPPSPSTYLHRIGRTGRAGLDGSAVMLYDPMEKGFLKSLEDMPIERRNASDFPLTPEQSEMYTKEIKALANYESQLFDDAYIKILSTMYQKATTLNASVAEIDGACDALMLNLGIDDPPPKPRYLQSLLDGRRSREQRILESQERRSRNQSRRDSRPRRSGGGSSSSFDRRGGGGGYSQRGRYEQRGNFDRNGGGGFGGQRGGGGFERRSFGQRGGASYGQRQERGGYGQRQERCESGGYERRGRPSGSDRRSFGAANN